MLEQVVHVRQHVEAGVCRQGLARDARAGDQHHAQLGHLTLHRREGIGDVAQQWRADGRAADRGDDELLVAAVAVASAQRIAVGERVRVERQGVAGEGEVAPGPVADPRQAGTERQLGDVFRVADEDRPVADPRIAGDVLDVVGVAVGAQVRLALVALLHRQAADEVGQEHERLALELRVLVIVVVDFPGLVADDDVVVLLAQHVGEGQEVARHHLVHRAQREERLQVVLARLRLEVTALVGEPRGDRMQPLALALEVGRRRIDREPVDLEVGLQLRASRARSPGRAGRGRDRSRWRRTARGACAPWRATQVERGGWTPTKSRTARANATGSRAGSGGRRRRR